MVLSRNQAGHPGRFGRLRHSRWFTVPGLSLSCWKPHIMKLANRGMKVARVPRPALMFVTVRKPVARLNSAITSRPENPPSAPHGPRRGPGLRRGGHLTQS